MSSSVDPEPDHDEGGKDKQPSGEKSNSSQAYKKYLEEMEYRIRYIKNDIEFKQEQIRKRNVIDLPSKIKDDSYSQSISWSNSESRGTKPIGIMSVTSDLSKPNTLTIPTNGHTRTVLSKAHTQVIPSKAHLQTIYNKAHSQIVPRKDNSLYSQIFPSKTHSRTIVSRSHSQPITSTTPFQTKLGRADSQTIPNASYCQTTSHQVLSRNSSHLSDKGERSLLNNIVSDSKVGHPPESIFSASVPVSGSTAKTLFRPADSRVVVVPKSVPGSQFLPVQHLSENSEKIVMPLKQGYGNQRTVLHVTQNHSKVHIVDAVKSLPNQTFLTSNAMNISSLCKSSQNLQNSPSKYTYIAPKSLGSSETEKRSSLFQEMPVLDASLNSTNSVGAPRIVLKKQTSIESQGLKHFTPLKIKTAAKLVSKYKWKRPSPTSLFKTAPQFCSPGRSRILTRDQKSFSKATLPYKGRKGNLFKLDKRKLKQDISNSGTYHQTENLKGSNKLCSLEAADTNNEKLNIKSTTFSVNDSVQGSSVHHHSTSFRKDLNRNQHFNSRYKLLKKTSGKTLLSLGNKDNRHRWTSADVKTKDLKKSFSAARYTELARYRWKHSKSEASGVAMAMSISNFQRSQMQEWESKVKHRPSQFHVKSFAGQPYANQHLQQSKLVMIGGVVYRSSLRSLTRAGQAKGNDLKSHHVKLINLRGVRYHLDARGKRLCRAHGSTGVKASVKLTTLSSEKSTDIQRKMAARALNRSLAYVAAKHKKDNRLKKGKLRLCIFFCRFGKCHRGDTCPFVHDQNKVSVCTRFLRGKCDIANCLFSHDASVHKIPVCLYYLQGLCSREDCLYLHVNVSSDAPSCKDFLQGYCSFGNKCKKLHSFVCPNFAVFGKCLKGDKCSLLHRHTKKAYFGSLSKKARPVKSSQTVPGKLDERSVKSVASLPSTLSPSVNTASPASSPLTLEESNTSPCCGKSSPLKMQPAFISISTLNNSEHSVPVSLRTNKASPKVRKPRIKPEFLHSKDENTTLHTSNSPLLKGIEIEPKAVKFGLFSNTELNVGEVKEISTAKASKKINFTSPTEGDFIRVESPEKHSDSEEASFDPSASPTSNKDSDSEKIKSKVVSSLLKGIEIEPKAVKFGLFSNTELTVGEVKVTSTAKASKKINFTSPTESDFIRVESSGKDSEEASFDPSASPTQNKDSDSEKIKSKVVSSKAALFKGIIPNFLPSSLPSRNPSGSQ